MLTYCSIERLLSTAVASVQVSGLVVELVTPSILLGPSADLRLRSALPYTAVSTLSTVAYLDLPKYTTDYLKSQLQDLVLKISFIGLDCTKEDIFF